MKLTKQLREIKPYVGKPSLRTARTITWDDVRLALSEVKNAKRRVRVYSDAGFVPNSYRWPCRIQWVEIRKVPDGLEVDVGWSGAQRSGGRGKLLVVQ
jgi:hypothetical protein